MGGGGAAAPFPGVTGGPIPDPGLCGSCAHVRVVETRTGSRFFLCGLSTVDERFARYPRLPVLRCAGFGAAERQAGPA